MRITLLICSLCLGCDDGGARADDAASPDMAATDSNPADTSPIDAAPVDAAPDAEPDMTPDAALSGTVRLNEVDCRAAPWVELFSEGGPARLDGLTVGAIALRGTLDGFLRVDLSRHLTCAVDPVVLEGPDGELERTTPPLDVAAVTWGRLPDGAGPWQPTEPTPAAPNRAPSPGGEELFDGQVHALALDLAEGSVPVLERERNRAVEGTLQIDGPALPARVRVAAPGGRTRRADQKATFEVALLEPLPDGLTGVELQPSLLNPAVLTAWSAAAIARDAGVPTQRMGFARLTVDDTDRGLYLLADIVDTATTGRWFPSTWHLYRATNVDLLPAEVDRFVPTVGDASDSRDLRWILDRMPEQAPEGETSYALTETFVDWPQVTRALALEAWLGSVDGYGPTRVNLQFHVSRDTRLSLVPYGLDMSMRAALQPFRGAGRLLNICLADTGCRAEYEQALIDVSRAAAGADRVAELRAQAAIIRPEVARNPLNYWSVEEFDRQVEARAAFLEARLAEMTALADCLETDADADGDGWRCAADCAPDDPAINVAASETCGNGRDEDCSGTADDGASCPDCRPVQRGGTEYLICPRRRAYAAAEQLCESLGARMVQIDGPGEDRWLFTQAIAVQRQDYWLGLTDREEEGAFVWPDGSPVTHARWNNGEPNDANGEDCAHWRRDGRWNDAPCESTFGIICELPCAPRDADGDGVDGCSLDCDDDDPAIPAEDVCGDGVDSDCDGLADNVAECPCTAAFRDAHRYLFCPERLNFARVATVCAEQDSAPVIVDDPEENRWLYETGRAIRYQRWWIGLSDAEDEGQYRWADGSRLRFGAWSRGEPNDSGRREDCAHFWDHIPNWNDIGCGARNGIICEDLRAR